MKDFDQPGHLAPTGLHLAGTKYMVIQGEAGAVIRGKKVIYILYMYSALTWNEIFSIVEPVIHFYYPLIFIINVFFISQKEDYAFLKVYLQHGTFCKFFFSFLRKIMLIVRRNDLIDNMQLTQLPMYLEWQGSGGVTIKKTGQALVFGIYEEPVTPGQCNMIVERLGDYLIDQGL